MDEFNVSESCLRKRKHLLMIFPVIMLCLAGFSLFVVGYKVGETEVLVPAGFIFLATAIFLAIQMPAIFKGISKIKVIIDDDRIIKQIGKHQQAVSWNDIIKMRLIENVKGELTFIRLYLRNKKTIYLFGFDEMARLANLIKEKISDKVLVQTKHYRLDWDDPALSVLTVVCMMIVLVFIASKGLKAMDIFFSFFFLSLGSYALIFRPLTKGGLSFKWLEIIVGILLIIVGICLLFLLHFIF